MTNSTVHKLTQKRQLQRSLGRQSWSRHRGWREHVRVWILTVFSHSFYCKSLKLTLLPEALLTCKSAFTGWHNQTATDRTANSNRTMVAFTTCHTHVLIIEIFIMQFISDISSWFICIKSFLFESKDYNDKLYAIMHNIRQNIYQHCIL